MFGEIKDIPPLAIISVLKIKKRHTFGKLTTWWAKHVEKAERPREHSALYIGQGHHLIFEATLHGNQFNCLEKYLKPGYYLIETIALTDMTISELQKGKDYMYSRTPLHKYDKKGIYHRLFPWIKENPDKDYCSELCINTWNAMRPGILPQGLSPSGLRDALNKLYCTKLVFAR